MGTILTEIVTILVGGIQTMGTGIAEGVSNMVKTLFFTGTGTTSDPYVLTAFGGVLCVFAGVSLAMAITKKVYHFVASLGATGK